MNQTRAVLFLPDDASCEGVDRPLMLQSVLFCPLLTWVGKTLMARSIQRFFIVWGKEEYAAELRGCFPAEADVLVSGSREALMDFLSQEGEVAVFPCEMLPLELPGGSSYAYTAKASALRESWTNGSDAVPGARELSGFSAVYDLPRLREMELACRDEIVRRHVAAGVHILDGSSVYIDPRVEIGAGTVVLPGTILRGETTIGRDCEIGPNAMIRDCTVGDGTTVNASQANESTIGSRVKIGPFAYIRPGCTIGNDIKVGDFVEVKNSVIGDGTKISHLTYVGDSDVGQKVNFGCGTVTTNYDGFKKYRCTIGDHAFIGCNTNLIAPVKVGDGAYTAAGSTITDEVPADALAVARARQKNLEGWAARRRALHAEKKD
ncbi:glucosamine-1-phosphate N-acetyltransferase [Oscillibacter hominis]|uniref:Glucosamine-1-phosphate N-acetyltransferase n=1 Tax=Oscillibacter hominis TaxID=2763056 RepID=A0A7G9B347_9FIRM|nr:DapH/DapD/GlmU-related protein [Oscillibacter hominis]QNL43978.1 glucosamine-1-phosphate N-acetyltransferase [Oscillibacter hominis]